MRRTYRTLYRLGIAPWNRPEVPGPITDLVEGAAPLPPAKAVDLGCGTGRQARYLAAHGWSVTALDYTREAVAAARRADPGNLVVWRVADVTDPASADPDGQLAGTVSLLLDNGCLHGIPDERRPGWASTVGALAAPDAVLLVRATPRRCRGIGPQGITEGEITTLLAGRWRASAHPEPDWFVYSNERHPERVDRAMDSVP
ncbi:methyltransferase domain-containing protein [Kitasatospora sp. NBC_00070]|uniref:class I SAM-dependent methyltransferase n=1 Tax=Kitasatospora sp. NBC_00070 TaxID=2975962 RepID=UPI003252EF67